MFPLQDGTFRGVPARALKSPDRPCLALTGRVRVTYRARTAVCPEDRGLSAPCPHFFPDLGLFAPSQTPLSMCFAHLFSGQGSVRALSAIPLRIFLHVFRTGLPDGALTDPCPEKDEQKTRTRVFDRVRTATCPEKNAWGSIIHDPHIETVMYPGAAPLEKVEIHPARTKSIPIPKTGQDGYSKWTGPQKPFPPDYGTPEEIQNGCPRLNSYWGPSGKCFGNQPWPQCLLGSISLGIPGLSREPGMPGWVKSKPGGVSR